MSITQLEMLKLISQTAKKNGIPIVQTNDNSKPSLHLHLGLQCEIDDLYIDIILQEESYVTSYAYIDQKAGDRVHEVGEFLNYLNRDETFSHFNLQYDTGMIGYVASFPFIMFEIDQYFDRLWLQAIRRFQLLAKPLYEIIVQKENPIEVYNNVIEGYNKALGKL